MIVNTITFANGLKIIYNINECEKKLMRKISSSDLDSFKSDVERLEFDSLDFYTREIPSSNGKLNYLEFKFLTCVGGVFLLSNRSIDLDSVELQEDILISKIAIKNYIIQKKEIGMNFISNGFYELFLNEIPNLDKSIVSRSVMVEALQALYEKRIEKYKQNNKVGNIVDGNIDNINAYGIKHINSLIVKINDSNI